MQKSIKYNANQAMPGREGNGHQFWHKRNSPLFSV
jgi:hypothetical protein